MAEIAPLRGITYNQRVVPELSAVVTPPYDVIEPEEQPAYHHRHPYNFIRLILGKTALTDAELEVKHQQAASHLQAWMQQRVLVQDSLPALYDYELDYQDSSGVTKTRRGFICLVRLEEFASRGIRPHERTYEATKSERLKLMLTCHANFSQIFSLYTDPEQVVARALEDGRHQEPFIDFTDASGIKHRLWRVTERSVIEEVAAFMQGKPLFIADGHHRYETAIAYQRLMREKYPDRGRQASFNYVLMYLSNMYHDGLSILPTHRLFSRLPAADYQAMLARIQLYFNIVHFPFTGADRTQVTQDFLRALRQNEPRKAIGVYVRDSGEYLLLQLAAGVDPEAVVAEVSPQLRQLVVVLLTELLFKKTLGIGRDFLDDESAINYDHSDIDAIARVDSGEYQAAFLINPTRIEQVREVADAGLIMPHKATYFYPKVINGTILRLIDPQEDVSW